MLKKLQKKYNASLIVVDAGNLLFKNPLSLSATADNSVALIVARGIVRGYKEMSYDGVVISGRDLSAGLAFFQETAEQGFPWLSANLLTKDDKPLFKPHIIKEINGFKVGIVGLTNKMKEPQESYYIGDWRKALETQVASLSQSCDLIILLSSLDSHENLRIQQDFQQIDIIITADKKGSNTVPRIRNNTILVESGGRGKYLGRLNLSTGVGRKWKPDPTVSTTQLQNRIRGLDYQIEKIEIQKQQTGIDNSKKIARLRLAREQLIERARRRQQAATDSIAKGQRLFTNGFLPVEPSSSSSTMTGIVRDIKSGIATYNRYRNSRQNREDKVLRLALQSDQIEGVSACTECHEEQATFWRGTRHARAYTTLTEHGQSHNLQCLPCHVTPGRVRANSKEGERLWLLSLTRDRQTIGCEVCHGPANNHLNSHKNSTVVRLPSEEVCTNCHSPEHDHNFNYATKLAAVSCPAGKGK